MNINNHRLEGDKITFQETPNTSGSFDAELPDTIVIHFTAGSTAQSAANWLCNKKAKASAHVVIGKDGEIIQLAPFDIITWHAGNSSWNNRKGLNKYSIGIEIDNPGRLTKRVNGFYTYFGKKIDDEMVVEAIHQNESEPSYWCAYTQAQIIVTRELCFMLKQEYGIHTIVGHEEISPGRKTDPGPAFPLGDLRNQVLNNNRQADEQADNITDKNLGMVTANLLNIRSAPGTSAYTVADPLKKGTMLTILQEQNGWYKVKVETEGWVSKDFVKK